jgi:hypothetical protein
MAGEHMVLPIVVLGERWSVFREAEELDLEPFPGEVPGSLLRVNLTKNIPNLSWEHIHDISFVSFCQETLTVETFRSHCGSTTHVVQRGLMLL